MRLLVALPLFAFLAAGCASNEPDLAARPSGRYFEEIKGPAPRDPLLFDPNCIVR